MANLVLNKQIWIYIVKREGLASADDFKVAHM